MPDHSEWIYAKDAVLMVERVLKGRGDAKRAIAECLRDGDVRSMASRYWISRATPINDAWKSEPEADEVDTDVEIRKGVYQSSKQWSLDQEEWRWPVNKFSVTSSIKPRKRRMLAGVKLNRIDIERVILKRNPNEVGSPGKPDQWTTFCFTLLKLERDGHLNEITYPTMAALREDVLEAMGGGLSEKTIKPAISQVWTKFVKGRLLHHDS